MIWLLVGAKVFAIGVVAMWSHQRSKERRALRSYRSISRRRRSTESCDGSRFWASKLGRR